MKKALMAITLACCVVTVSIAGIVAGGLVGGILLPMKILGITSKKIKTDNQDKI